MVIFFLLFYFFLFSVIILDILHLLLWAASIDGRLPPLQLLDLFIWLINSLFLHMVSYPQ